MKTTILSLLLFAASTLGAQTVNVTLQTSFQLSVLQDILTHYTDQVDYKAGTTGAVQAADTSFTITAGQLGAGQTLPGVGSAIFVDSEAMVVTAVTPGTGSEVVTVTRAAFPNFTAAGHASGSFVYLLHYASPWEMVAQEALRSWVKGVVSSLASQNRSATFSSTTSGSVQ